MRDPVRDSGHSTGHTARAASGRTPAWVAVVFSSTTFTVVAAVLAFGWFLARHKVEGLHSLDDLSLMQLSTQSWFTRAWGSSVAILALPAAAGFGVGWSAHRRGGSAAGTAIAAVAVVTVALWQMGDKREDDSKFRRAAASAPAASGLAVVAPAAPAEKTDKDDVKLSIVEEAERNLARAKAEEEAAKGEGEKTARAKALQAAEAAKVAKAAEAPDAEAGSQRKTGTVAPAVQPTADAGALLLSNRTKLVVQTEAAPPSVSGPGVRPTAQPVQEEKALAYPGFPGCRWATPTQWVCDGKQP